MGGLARLAASALLLPACAQPAVWGLNYDHDRDGRLLEDYWVDEWDTVAEDFREMKDLGANLVRIHLQLGKFMLTAEQADPVSLERLARLVRLAEDLGLRLDVTGLGCYHKHEVPAWYDALGEADRWRVQARFWEEVARTCAGSRALYCYDLMNEPVLPDARGPETDWLPGEGFAGKHFVQYVSLDLAGRTREQVARAWVDALVAAIRKHDARTPITVGEIPWAFIFPGAGPFFSKPEVGAQLDLVSVHFYPKSGEVDKALAALEVYRSPKPLIVEETFPLECRIEELDAFIEGSRAWTAGYVGFYWGETIEELARRPDDLAAAIIKEWLLYFRANSPSSRPRLFADSQRSRAAASTTRNCGSSKVGRPGWRPASVRALSRCGGPTRKSATARRRRDSRASSVSSVWLSVPRPLRATNTTEAPSRRSRSDWSSRAFNGTRRPPAHSINHVVSACLRPMAAAVR